ncbi:MAG: 4-alpha-glucanotransferase [Chitinophagaceae bacterium]|nr:MAG: 4-alpha-glucanotransferase [Chitinophagaceae bacterium]
MTINFYVAFQSSYGQSLAIKIFSSDKKGDVVLTELPLHYLNEDYWFLSLDTNDHHISDQFEYSYLYKDNNIGIEREFSKSTPINLKKLGTDRLDIVDEWKDENFYEEVFASTPFVSVFQQKEKVKAADTKNPSHFFKVKAPALAAGKVVALSGGCKKLNDWNSAKPLLMEFKKNHWQLKVNLSKEHFPLEYKLGIYDLATQQLEFEEGNNRELPLVAEKNTLTILHHTLDTSKFRWKGAGVNIPVSALKSEHSWGVGDFTDLQLLVDVSGKAGFRMIQLLPINDTTATHTNKDSYPYSAVSAFALHPIYLNVQKLGTALSVKFTPAILKQVAELNEKDSLYYEEVMSVKQAAIRMLYNQDRDAFKDDFSWFSFFDLHRHWLVPYAAYCYLRDKNKSADYETWGSFAEYDEEAIQDLVSPENEFYDEVAIHYYTQFHLHLQLKDAVDYAHKNGIIIKGDLPIGVGRHSCDAWMYRHLFHMDKQAGAPPDAFATKGQNWSFPTYNWERMAEDDYAWWRQRMEHMGNYFDAIRIDHVLGFFRIWSIPLDAVEGILGKFVPAWPIPSYDFSNAGLHFEEQRFCLPYITNDLLQRWFGSDAQTVEETFLDAGRFKPNFDTQRKVAAYLKEHPELRHLQQGLFDLFANIIAIKDDTHAGNYHLRIGMHGTESYKALPQHEQAILNRLFDDYFFKKQNQLWEEEGINKLNALKRSTNMLICAEDLGMVPEMVESVLENLKMLALEVQRMPKKAGEEFSNPFHSPYLSVVTPSTHDMATIREWWEEDKATIQKFYNNQLQHNGDAPFYAEPWICRDIVKQHLQSPAMWAVFLLQDLLAMDENIRKEDPRAERINNPADPDHYWNYRMHITLEQLAEQSGFIVTLKHMVTDSGR